MAEAANTIDKLHSELERERVKHDQVGKVELQHPYEAAIIASALVLVLVLAIGIGSSAVDISVCIFLSCTAECITLDSPSVVCF